MSYLRTVAFAFGLIGLAAGCGNEVVKKMDDFADRACTCADAACAEKVHQEFMKYINDNQSVRGSEGDAKKVEAASNKMMKCVTDAKAKAGAAPAEAPPPSEPAAPGGGATAPAGGATAPATPPADGAATPAPAQTPPPSDPAGAAPAAPE